MVGMNWTVETVSSVDAEIEALPVKLRARLVRLLGTTENVGLEALREPHVKHLDGKLWELRVRAEGGDRTGNLRDGGATWCCMSSRRSRKERRGERSRPPGNA